MCCSAPAECDGTPCKGVPLASSYGPFGSWEWAGLSRCAVEGCTVAEVGNASYRRCCAGQCWGCTGDEGSCSALSIRCRIGSVAAVEAVCAGLGGLQS